MTSVPNSSTGLIFVKIRAESGRILLRFLAKIRAKPGQNLSFCEFVVFLWFVYVQHIILPFGKQFNNALDARHAQSHKSPGVIRAIFSNARISGRARIHPDDLVTLQYLLMSSIIIADSLLSLIIITQDTGDDQSLLISNWQH